MSPNAAAGFPTKRLKHLVTLRRRRTAAGDVTRPYIGLEDIESGTGRLVNAPEKLREGGPSAPSMPDDCRRTPHVLRQDVGRNSPAAPDGNEATGTDFEPGDVLFGKLRPYLAKAWVAEFPGRCTTEALVMEPTLIEPRFLRSVCLSSRFVGDVDASTFGSKMPRAEWDFIGNMPIPVPDPDTQTAIANYIDHETSRLDALLAATQRLLTLLTEKRRAVITRGLDPSVLLRDSGDPHAERDQISATHPDRSNTGPAPPIKRIRFITERDLSEEKQRILRDAKEATFLPMESIGEHGDLDCSATRYVDDVRNSYTQFFDGDVLVAKITPCFENGKGAIVNGTLNGIGFGTTELHVLTPTSEIDARYLYYTTISDRFRKLGEAAMFGAAGQKRVPENFVRNYRIPVPPLAEQRTIVDQLDVETTRIDALMERARGAIALVNERRAALIAAAVTGSVDIGAAL